MESHTAAFLEPYSDDPSTKGALFWDPEKYKAAVAELDKKGFQLYTHAIGDYAVRTALDAYEFAEQKNHTKDHRNRVEHIETISTADIPRFGKLGVIASMQPLHSYPDADTLDVWARNIGPDRASRAWVWKSIAAVRRHTILLAATGRSSLSIRGKESRPRSHAKLRKASPPAVLFLRKN